MIVSHPGNQGFRQTAYPSISSSFLKPQGGCLIIIFTNNIPGFLTLDFTLKALFKYVSSAKLFIIIYRCVCAQGHSSQYLDRVVFGTFDDHGSFTLAQKPSFAGSYSTSLSTTLNMTI